MSDDESRRDSRALHGPLITDPKEKARAEARNGLRQFDIAVEAIEAFTRCSDRQFKLRPSLILQLHHAALEGIERFAGTFRNAPVKIKKSKHVPPEFLFVSEFVNEMCGYVNDKWNEASAIHLAAYVMWRLNWIHPFSDGNGRTSRAVSYVVLCIRAGYLLPGEPTIPEMIADDRGPYYAALDAADETYLDGEQIDVSEMEQLIESLLSKQLLTLFHQAKDQPDPPRANRQIPK